MRGGKVGGYAAGVKTSSSQIQRPAYMDKHETG